MKKYIYNGYENASNISSWELKITAVDEYYSHWTMALRSSP